MEKLDQEAHAVPAPMQPATASLFVASPFSDAEGILNLLFTHPWMRKRIQRLRAKHDQTGLRPVGARDATLDARW